MGCGARYPHTKPNKIINKTSNGVRDAHVPSFRRINFYNENPLMFGEKESTEVLDSLHKPGNKGALGTLSNKTNDDMLLSELFKGSGAIDDIVEKNRDVEQPNDKKKNSILRGLYIKNEFERYLLFLY